MKYLIVNIDDVGLSDAINQAVKKCYLSGAITGVSIMPLAKNFQEACTLLHDLKKTEVGVHLSFVNQKEKGKFLGYQHIFLKFHILKKMSSQDIYNELRGQIIKVKEAGLVITHLDSHEYIHMFPMVLRIVIRLMKEYDIPYLRFPSEQSHLIKKKFRSVDLFRYVALKTFVRNAKSLIKSSCIQHNDHYLGHFHAGRIDDEILSFMIQGLTEGITELVVHPGVDTPELVIDSPWHHQAPRELRTLLGHDWRRLLHAQNVQLISHKEAVAI